MSWEDLINGVIETPARGRPGAAPRGVRSDTRELLAKTIQAEAGGESPLGQLAVASVIANRASTSGYGGSINDVIMKPGQFSAWNSVTGYAGGQGGLNMSRIHPSQTAYAAADAVLSGNYNDPTEGATHYYNPRHADPKWGVRSGGEWSRIGNHIFGSADAGRAPGPGHVTNTEYTAPEPMDFSRLWLDMGGSNG